MEENFINKPRKSRNNFERLKKLFSNPKRYMPFFLGKVAPYIKNDELYLRILWRLNMGTSLNLKTPKTFNEKLQWLKLHDRKPEYTQMVDKYEAKKYVANIIGEEYIIPTLGVWDRFDDIDFDKLPNQFVLKWTHDSGGLVICRNKSTLDIQAAKAKMDKFQKRNYFMQNREWPYKNVKPRIIAEKYMEDESGYELKDYKVFNFNGKAKFIQVDYGRFMEHMRNLYSSQWEFIEATINYPNNLEHEIPKPEKLNEMIALAEKLSEGHPFLRTDFYSIENKLYFGEITFFPESGFMNINPKELGVELGRIIKLARGGVIVEGDGYMLWLHENTINKDLKDYKFFCFGGVAKCFKIDFDRFIEHHANYYDIEGNILKFGEEVCPPVQDKEIDMPKTLEKMIELAEKLTKGTPFLRADFYDVNGHVYFGELTFFPASGFGKFTSEECDEIMGKWLQLPNTQGGGDNTF